MTSTPGRGLLHLAAAVDLPGVRDSGPYLELALLAERGGLDFVTLDDAPDRPGPDAPAVLCEVAPATRRVGLVAALGARAEPFRARAAVAALDRASRGRAGRLIDVATAEDEAGPAGRASAAGPDAPGLRARGDTGAATGPGEGTREARRDRFTDRDASHLAGFGRPASAGEQSAGAPGHARRDPVRVVDATDGHARSVAARHADVALVRAADPGQARAVRDRLRCEAAGAGRDPDSLRVLARLLIDLGDGERAADPGHGGGGPRPTPRGPLYRGGPVDLADLIAAWRRDGAVDGFHLTAVEPRRDLERLVNGTVALLQHRGLFRTFYPGSTLREHLGLTGPADRRAGGTA